jgi:hypothetical protein
MLNGQLPVGVSGATQAAPEATASATAEPTASAVPSPMSDPTASPSPTPAPAFAITVEHAGGLMGMDDYSAIMPPFTLLDDGRVIVPANPQTPPTGWPAVEVRELSEAGVAAIRDLVDATGQLSTDASWSGATAIVADAGGTSFIARRGDSTVTVNVYALGALTTGDIPPSVSADELAAHRTLYDTFEQLTTIGEWLPPDAWLPASAWEPYEPDAIRLFARKPNPYFGPEIGEFDEVPWPTAVDPSWVGYPMSEWGEFRCGMATGDDLEAWRAALSAADEMTRFVADGQHYRVTVRLMLPDELAECPQS